MVTPITKREFIANVLRDYSSERGELIKLTSELSPLERYLLLRLSSEYWKSVQVVTFLDSIHRKHYESPDDWYSCPKSKEGCADPEQGKECNCGADFFNQNLEGMRVFITDNVGVPSIKNDEI
jgi:hypothetical protein